MALYELDEFQGPEFLGYVRGVPEPEAYSGAQFLPNTNVDDLVFEYIKGVNNQPVMAHVMGYDSEAPIQGRRGLGERVQGELPPIKRKARFTEKEIIRFLQPRANSADEQTAINSVYDLTDSLIGAIRARVEWLRLKALSESTLTYDEGGVKFEFDFGVNKAFQFDLTAGTDGNTDAIPGTGGAWSVTGSAQPLADIQFLADQMQDETGERPSTMVLSRKALGYLLQNESLRDLVRGANAPTQVLNLTEIQTLFDVYGLPTLQTYDVRVQQEAADGTQAAVRPLAENRAFLVPGGASIGNTLWGPTAESRALMGTPVASEAPGIYAVTYGTEEPPAEWVKAAAVAFPTMPNVHLLGQMELFDL